jgi:hypothetical protein
MIDVYHILSVNITSRTDTFPPQWLPITVDPIPEDEPQNDLIKLKKYVFDPDDSLDNLTFSIYSVSQSGYLDVAIDEDTFLTLMTYLQ